MVAGAGLLAAVVGLVIVAAGRWSQVQDVAAADASLIVRTCAGLVAVGAGRWSLVQDW